MHRIENLFQEEILLSNIKIAAYFILLYEHFEDVVISTVKEFYSDTCVLDGKAYSNIDDAYIRCIEKKIENGENDYPVPWRIRLASAKRDRETYKKEILGNKEEDAKAFRGSLRWLRKYDVISEEEYNAILSIRKRRNILVHELLKEIGSGLTEQDIEMIGSLLDFQQRINAWRFQQIDMPVMGIELPQGADADDVLGGDDAVLACIFRILFCGEGSQFKETLEKELIE